MKQGDKIRRRGRGRLWEVLEVRPDGTLRVGRWAIKKKWYERVIKRAEDYHVVWGSQADG